MCTRYTFHLLFLLSPDLGLWAIVERAIGAFLGRCGLLRWTIDGVDEVELAYLIDKARWGEGFATEAAHAIVAHALDALRLECLIAFVTSGTTRRRGSPSRRGWRSSASTPMSTGYATSTPTLCDQPSATDSRLRIGP